MLADDGELGERTVIARSSSGAIARFQIQSTSITAADRNRTRESVLAPLAAPEYTDTAPEDGTFSVDPDPLPNGTTWTPLSAVATTRDTIAVAWTEPGFTAEIVGGATADSVDGQVVIGDLKPDTQIYARLVPESGGMESRELLVQAETLPAITGVTALTYQKYSTAYVHKTFIAEASVSAAFCGNFPTYTFGGDGRGYQLPSASTPNDAPNYRTMMFANVSWDSPAADRFSWTKKVGASKIYNNGKLVKTLYASTKDMKVQSVQASKSYAKAYFNHTASNPHCSFLNINYGGAIRYAEWVEFYRGGTVAIDGYRYKAPRHEMYGRFNTASGSSVWKTIAQRPNDGFHCLLGNVTCALDFYQKSASN